jgi:hypothetical protein
MKENYSEKETELWSNEILDAITHAVLAHGSYGKTPKDKIRFHDHLTPYVVHPTWCAMTLLMEPSLPKEIRRLGYQALLWHDTLEDTNLPLPSGVSDKVRNLVLELTFESFEEETIKIWGRSDTAKLLKLYDKTSNLLDGSWMSKDKWNKYITHTSKLADATAIKFGEGLNIIRIARAFCVAQQ